MKTKTDVREALAKLTESAERGMAKLYPATAQNLAFIRSQISQKGSPPNLQRGTHKRKQIDLVRHRKIKAQTQPTKIRDPLRKGQKTFQTPVGLNVHQIKVRVQKAMRRDFLRFFRAPESRKPRIEPARVLLEKFQLSENTLAKLEQELAFAQDQIYHQVAKELGKMAKRPPPYQHLSNMQFFDEEGQKLISIPQHKTAQKSGPRKFVEKRTIVIRTPEKKDSTALRIRATLTRIGSTDRSASISMAIPGSLPATQIAQQPTA